MWIQDERNAYGRCRLLHFWQSAKGNRLRSSLAVLVASALLCCVLFGCSGGGGIAGRYVREGYPDRYLIIREDGTWTSQGWYDTESEGYLHETTGRWERNGDEIKFIVWLELGFEVEPTRPHEIRGNKVVLDLWGMLEDIVWVKQ